MAIQIIQGDAARMNGRADLIFTDPPFDIPGARLARILQRYSTAHIVLIVSMRQILDLVPCMEGWTLGFDFVLDTVTPKKSMSASQPNYTHATGVYLRRAPSIFDRRRRQRSDTFDANGYWPTVIRAPRQKMQEFGQAKNEDAVLDLLGSFNASSVIDPFAGSFTTALAAARLDLDCLTIEIDPGRVDQGVQLLEFFGTSVSVLKPSEGVA